MRGPEAPAATTGLLLLVPLAVVGWLVVSPAATVAVAGAGLVLVVGVASVAAGHGRREAARVPVVAMAEPAREDPALPSLWIACLVSFMIFALDFGAFLTGLSALRYLFLLVPMAVLVVSARSPHGRPGLRAPDVVLGALFLWGMAGALYGKLVTHPVSSSLTIVLPMGVGLLHLWNSGRPTDEHSRRMLRYLTNIGLAYVLIYLAARLGVGPLSIIAYSKEKSFLLALAPMAAFVTRRWWFFTVELVALAVIYLEEPAATFVVVLVAVVVTNMLLSARSGALKVAAAVGLSVCVFFGFSLIYRAGNNQATLIAKYFEAVGKGDNTPFRTVLLRKGAAVVEAHPVLGSNFAGEVGIETNFPGIARFAPAHNDFLQLAMAGGLVALALYLYWILATNRRVHAGYRKLVDAGDLNSARLVRVLVTSFNAFLFSSLFNPLLAGVGIGVMFFLLYGSMRLLEPEDVAPGSGQPAPAGARRA